VAETRCRWAIHAHSRHACSSTAGNQCLAYTIENQQSPRLHVRLERGGVAALEQHTGHLCRRDARRLVRGSRLLHVALGLERARVLGVRRAQVQARLVGGHLDKPELLCDTRAAGLMIWTSTHARVQLEDFIHA
jgi:hypothetical protein